MKAGVHVTMSKARAVGKQREAVGPPPPPPTYFFGTRWGSRRSKLIRSSDGRSWSDGRAGSFGGASARGLCRSAFHVCGRKHGAAPSCFTKTLNPAQGRSSGTVLVRSHYQDGNVLRPIPPDAVIASFEYERYFALVCGSNSPLVRRRNRGTIFSRQYEHLLTGKRGFGQLTTFPVRRVSDDEVGPEYPVEFRARLRQPYCAELKCSRPLTRHEQRLLDAVSVPGRTVADWCRFAARIRAKDKKIA